MILTDWFLVLLVAGTLAMDIYAQLKKYDWATYLHVCASIFTLFVIIILTLGPISKGYIRYGAVVYIITSMLVIIGVRLSGTNRKN